MNKKEIFRDSSGKVYNFLLSILGFDTDSEKRSFPPALVKPGAD